GARPKARVRPPLPRHARRLRRRGAGRARARQARQRPGGAAARRPAHARHERPRLPGQGARALPGRQARAAHGLRRLAGVDPGHQRDPARLLPDPAVGPAGGAPLPGDRRPARRLARRVPALVHRRHAGGPPLLGARPRAQGVPGPQPGALPLARRGALAGGGGAAAPGGRRLPLLLLPDGSALERPTVADVAARIGLRSTPELQLYALVIVGAGPAGLAAAVYAASEGLSTLLLERHSPGGQAGMSSRIENYLGFPSGLSGAELSRRAAAQARRFGAEILTPPRRWRCAA